MRRRRRGVECGLATLLALALSPLHPPEASEAPRSQLSVQIVPTSSSDKSGRWLSLADDGSKHFHVVVTNLSNGPISLWQEWCSWGYFNLSFEARDAGGRTTTIAKKPRDWTRNFPCPVLIAASEHWVIDVDLEPSVWENSPLAGGSGRATVRLKAVFEIREDNESKKERVWTGRVSSPENEYTISWPGTEAKPTLERLQKSGVVKP